MGRTIGSAIAWWLIGAASGLLLGGATSFGQGYLPDGLRSFANSNSGWTLLAFVVVVICSRWQSASRWWIAAGLGLVMFHALLQGYALVSTLRGFPDSYGPDDFYFVVATLAGPVIGLAAVWSRSDRTLLRAVGIAVFAAVMIGDGISGLTRVAETTGWLYWVIAIALGTGALVCVVARRLSTWSDRALAILMTGVGAGAFVLLFSLL